jgi:ACR3 family arsenite efflux pump ArsB
MGKRVIQLRGKNCKLLKCDQQRENYKYVFLGVITGLNTMVKPCFLFALAIILTDLMWHKELWKSLRNGPVVLLATLKNVH